MSSAISTSYTATNENFSSKLICRERLGTGVGLAPVWLDPDVGWPGCGLARVWVGWARVWVSPGVGGPDVGGPDVGGPGCG